MARALVTCRHSHLLLSACLRQHLPCCHSLSSTATRIPHLHPPAQVPGRVVDWPVRTATLPYIPSPLHPASSTSLLSLANLIQSQASLYPFPGVEHQHQHSLLSRDHLREVSSVGCAALAGAVHSLLDQRVRWATTRQVCSAQQSADTQKAEYKSSSPARCYGQGQGFRDSEEGSEQILENQGSDHPLPQESYREPSAPVEPPAHLSQSTAGRESPRADTPGSFHEGVCPQNRKKVQDVCSKFGFSHSDLEEACRHSPQASLQDPADVEQCLVLLASEGVPAAYLPTVAIRAHILSQADSFPAKVEFVRSLELRSSMRRLIVESPALWHPPLAEIRETASILKKVLSTEVAQALMEASPTVLAVPHSEMEYKLVTLRHLLGLKVLKVVARANPRLLHLPRSLIEMLSRVFGGDGGQLRSFLSAVDVRNLDASFEAKLSLLTSAVGEKATKRLAMADPRMVPNAENVVDVFSRTCEHMPHGEALRLLRDNPDLFHCSWNEKVGPALLVAERRLRIPPKKVLEACIWSQAFSPSELEARAAFLEGEGVKVVDSRKSVKKLKGETEETITLAAVLQPLQYFKKQFRHYEGP